MDKQILELAKQLIQKETNSTQRNTKQQNKQEAVANNNTIKQTRDYNSLELKIFDTADYTIYLLEEMLKTAINQEEYCSLIYDSTHPDRTGKYNVCYRIEKVLNKYEHKWKTQKVMEEENKDLSPIAPIKPINDLK